MPLYAHMIIRFVTSSVALPLRLIKGFFLPIQLIVGMGFPRLGWSIDNPGLTGTASLSTMSPELAVHQAPDKRRRLLRISAVR